MFFQVVRPLSGFGEFCDQALMSKGIADWLTLGDCCAHVRRAGGVGWLGGVCS